VIEREGANSHACVIRHVTRLKKKQVESSQDEQHQLACKQKCKQEEIRDVKTKDHIPFFTLMTNAHSMFP